MKFLCDNCKAKYQIGDDKVAGKTVRMKCRKCGHSIQVTAAMADPGTADDAAGVEAIAATVPQASPSAGAIEPAASAIAAPAPAPRAAAPIARPGPARLDDPPTEDESTSIMTFPLPDGPKAPGAPGPVATRTPLTSSSMRPAIAARPAAPAKPIAPAPPPRPAGATSATLSAARVAGAPRPIAPKVGPPRPPNAPPSEPQGAGIAGAFARSAAADAPPAAARAAASEDWYVGIGGVPLGPVKVAVIRDKALAGVVDGESLVWREGLDEWRPLKTIPELLEAVSGPIALRRSSGQIPAVSPPAAPAAEAPRPPAPAATPPAPHAAPAPRAAPAPHVSTSMKALTPPNTVHAPSTTLTPSAAVAPPTTALTPPTTALTPPVAAVTPPAPPPSQPMATPAPSDAHVVAPIAPAAAAAATTALTNGKTAPLHVLSDPFAAPAAATPVPAAATPAAAPAPLPEPAIAPPASTAAAAAAAPEPSLPVPSAPVPSAPSAPSSTAGTTAPVKPAMEADLGDLVRVPRPTAHHPMAYAFVVAAAVFSGVAAWALFAKAPQQIVVVQQAASAPVKTEAKEKEPDTQTQVEVGDVVPGATGAAARPGVAQLGPRPKASAAASSGPAPAPLDTSGFSNTVPGPVNAPVGAPPVGGGQLSQGEISGVVAQNQALVKRKCWQPALESRSTNGPTNARVNGSITIGPSGNVDAASANGAERDFPGLSSCIAGRMKGWKFPPSGSSTTVNVPFVFAGQ